MIIDTHSHYNLQPLYDDWSKFWQAAQKQGVTNSVIVGTDLQSSTTAIDLVHAVSSWKAAVGIHPNSDYHQSEIEHIDNLLPSTDIVAIGECGLDYFRLEGTNRSDQIEKQHQRLIEHFHLAAKHQLPLIIHLRDTGDSAYWDFLHLYKQHMDTSRPFILHCVSGPIKFVHEAISLGAYIGVAGNVTYKSAEHIRDIIRSAPKDRVLLETDAPYLPPQAHRGHICEPSMIQLTQEFLNDELGITKETFFNNTLRIFPQFASN